MKIAVISDAHLGHAYGTELGEDAFYQFKQALQHAMGWADLIILAGDIFDERVPRQEVLAKAMEVLQLPHEKEGTGIMFSSFIGEHAQTPARALHGIPVVSVYGTHERRSAQSVNPIQLLEKAGFLINLHCNGVTFEKNGQKISIQGLSGVPERYVKPIIEQWSPKPVPDSFNIFVFHQSLKEYVYDPEDTFIGINDLPPDFDLYVDGHIHWPNVLESAGKRVIFPGSTVITQKKKIEAEKKKGFFKLEIEGSELSYEFIEIPDQRPFYYIEVKFKDKSPSQVVELARAKLSKIHEKKKPLLMLKLTGTLSKGYADSDIHQEDILRGYDFFATVKKEISGTSFRQRIEELRKSHAEKQSVEEAVQDMLRKLLESEGYDGPDPQRVVDALAEDDIDLAIQLMKQ